MKINKLKILNVFFVITLFILLFFQYQNKSKDYINNLPQQITNGFYGQKLAENYYEFNIIDYHRMLIFNQPFLLFFFSDNCNECTRENQIIHDFAKTGLAKDKIIIRVNYYSNNKFITENELINTYKISRSNILVAVDKDGVPIKIEPGHMQMEQIKDFLQLI